METISSLPDETQLAAADLVIVVLDSPDQYTEDQIEDALANSPLTRWLCVYGPWSESDGRNKSVWPFGVRVPWQRFPQRLSQEIAIFRNELAPLPLTATRNESFLFEQRQLETIAAVSASLPVVVVTEDMALADYYHQFLVRTGYDPLVERTAGSSDAATSPRVVLLDLDPWNKRRRQDLVRRIGTLDQRAFLIGVTNEINPDVIADMHAAGLPVVLPKLMGESALLRALTSIATST